jgi:hypothetical protein
MAYPESTFSGRGRFKSGDAIAVRFGDFSDRRTQVVVIDGGFKFRVRHSSAHSQGMRLHAWISSSRPIPTTAIRPGSRP